MLDMNRYCLNARKIRSLTTVDENNFEIPKINECSPPDVGGKVGCGLGGLREPTAPLRGFSSISDDI